MPSERRSCRQEEVPSSENDDGWQELGSRAQAYACHWLSDYQSSRSHAPSHLPSSGTPRAGTWPPEGPVPCLPALRTSPPPVFLQLETPTLALTFKEAPCLPLLISFPPEKFPCHPLFIFGDWREAAWTCRLSLLGLLDSCSSVPCLSPVHWPRSWWVPAALQKDLPEMNFLQGLKGSTKSTDNGCLWAVRL